MCSGVGVGGDGGLGGRVKGGEGGGGLSLRGVRLMGTGGASSSPDG